MLNPIDVDGRVVSWAAVAALLAGVAATLPPALRTVGRDLIRSMQGSASDPARGHGRLRGGLVAVQNALAVVLLIGTLLMGRALWTLLDVDVGWTAENAVALEPRLAGTRYEGVEARSRFLEQLADLTAAVPGVELAAPAEHVPRPPRSSRRNSCAVSPYAALRAPGIPRALAEERLMTSLRQRMLEDMQVRGLSPRTQQTYVETVARFARHFGRSPARLGLEEIRAYQVYLTNERRLASSSLVVAVSALRFLYRVTLRKRWVLDDVIPVPKKSRSLPVVHARRRRPRRQVDVSGHPGLLMTSPPPFARHPLKLLGFPGRSTCVSDASPRLREGFRGCPHRPIVDP